MGALNAQFLLEWKVFMELAECIFWNFYIVTSQEGVKSHWLIEGKSFHPPLLHNYLCCSLEEVGQRSPGNNGSYLKASHDES